MEFYFVPVTRENLASFLVYMLPHAAAELLGDDTAVLAVGVCTEKHSLGAAVLKRDGDETKLLSLYVDETARRLGVGAALLARALSFAQERWGEPSAVTASYIVPAGDAEAVDAFFSSQNFDVSSDTGRRVFAVNTADVREQALWSRVFSSDYKCDEHVVPFSALTPRQLRELEEDEAVPRFLKPSNAPEHVHKTISSAWVADGHALGCILFYIGFDEELVLLSAFTREGAGLMAFRSMLTASLNRAYYMLGRHFILHVHTVNPRAAGLVEKMTRDTYTEYASRSAVRY